MSTPRSSRRAGLRLRFEHDGAGAVAEQHAGGAVGPVEDAREGLRPDHQRPLEGAGPQERVGGRQREDEAGTHRLQVEGGAVVMPSSACTATALAGKVLSGVEVASTMRSIAWARDAHAPSAARAACAAICEVNFARRGDAALVDAGALHDPFVRRVDLAGEIGIGEDLARQIAAAAEDDRTRTVTRRLR